MRGHHTLARHLPQDPEFLAQDPGCRRIGVSRVNHFKKHRGAILAPLDAYQNAAVASIYLRCVVIVG